MNKFSSYNKFERDDDSGLIIGSPDVIQSLLNLSHGTKKTKRKPRGNNPRNVAFGIAYLY
ncbi:MAG: hypothetical protein MHPSP_001695, partial [Paramarteilia canceri]